MSVGLNLFVYRLREDFTFNVNDALSGQVVGEDNPDPRLTVFTAIPYQDAVEADFFVGLRGRRMQVPKVDEPGFITSTTINDFVQFSGGTKFFITDWSRQPPTFPAGIASIKYDESVEPIDSLATSYDVSQELIEDEINLTQQLEGEEKFNLETSFGDLKLDNSGQVKNLMDTYWKPSATDKFFVDKRHVFGIELTRDGVPEFWGVSEIEDIIYDAINDEYIFNIYDWLAYSLKTKADNWSPAIKTKSITSYLENSMINFRWTTPPELVTVVRIGNRSPILSDDYERWQFFFGADFEYRSIEENMRCDAFITEMQKHYGAFLFYGAGRQLFFVSRNYTTGDLNINNLIVEDTFTQTFALRAYNSLIVNYRGDWVTENNVSLKSEGWARVRKKIDEDRLEIIEGLSADEAGKIESALDLRQRLPIPVFQYLLFSPRSAEEAYDDYKELLNETKKFTCTIDTLGVSLLNRIEYKDKFYSVTRIKKNYILETSEIEMFEIVDDSLHEAVA